MNEKSKAAAGLEALLVTWEHAKQQTGAVRALSVLTRANQIDGFDCPGCAWPDPSHRAMFEFCENGAKAILDEATTRRVDPEFFAQHEVANSFEREESWLGAQGRITTPMILRDGAKHYAPLSYEEAYHVIAEELGKLDGPNQAAFYTSGRTSNEAAFLYQLMVRAWGTNNLPDCSNLCHESSGVALNESLGIGKGTVRLSDFDQTDLIFVIGQNPGSNHPRMLTALRNAKLNGASIISVNPLVERGLVRFAHPQQLGDLLSGGVDLADEFVRVNVNGDQALFRGLNKALIESGDVDRDFIETFTLGFDTLRAAAEDTSWEIIEAHSGVTRAQIEGLAHRVRRSPRIICCWAMGLTQHENAVVTIQEVTNFLLLRGNVGRPGVGACPVRGHSNVQGDRTVGISPELPPLFVQRMLSELGVVVPKERGLDTVGTILGMRSGDVRALICLGGNFLSASPDTDVTADALRRCALTVYVSTKLNKSHFTPGKTALILPCLGRTERDERGFVSVENSMGIVHASRGNLTPAHPNLRSEPRIVAELAARLLGHDHRLTADFQRWGADYDAVRDAIERVVPGFVGYNHRVREEGGFELFNGPRERRFTTPSGKAHFIPAALRRLSPEKGELVLMTLRSHDQFNTTVYSNEDRYRGISDCRRVLFLNRLDMQARGVAPGDRLRITSHHQPPAEIHSTTGATRTLEGFVAHPYDVPPGTAAAYFPEANPLIFLESMADRSRTPTSKSVRITVESLDSTAAE